MTDQMSDGERMIWASLYSDALSSSNNPRFAATFAANEIKRLREVFAEFSPWDKSQDDGAFLQDMLEGDTEDFPIAMTVNGDEVTERRRIR